MPSAPSSILADKLDALELHPSDLRRLAVWAANHYGRGAQSADRDDLAQEFLLGVLEGALDADVDVDGARGYALRRGKSRAWNATRRRNRAPLVLSLDAPLAADGANLYGLHGDPRQADPAELAEGPDLAASLERLVRELCSPIEAAVLRRTILEGATLRACGRELGVSREWVRQLRGRALARLRRHLLARGWRRP